MEAVIVPLALRGRLGDDGTLALEELLNSAGHHWREDVLMLAEERFEKRLTQEVSAVRLELANGLAAIRTELATTRVETLRWSFVFWIGQVAAIAGLLAWRGHP